MYCTTLNRRRSLQANARLKTTRRCCRRSFSRTPVNGSNTSSPANAPTMTKQFTVEVHLNSNVIGKGGGRSKKEAEQQAAREALELMGY